MKPAFLGVTMIVRAASPQEALAKAMQVLVRALDKQWKRK